MAPEAHEGRGQCPVLPVAEGAQQLPLQQGALGRPALPRQQDLVGSSVPQHHQEPCTGRTNSRTEGQRPYVAHCGRVARTDVEKTDAVDNWQKWAGASVARACWVQDGSTSVAAQQTEMCDAMNCADLWLSAGGRPTAPPRPATA